MSDRRVSFAIAALVAACAAACPSIARAGDDVTLRAVPSMRVFGDKDGVPQSSILAIAEEPNGRLWIGTQDGPASYDGHTWTPLPLPDAGDSVTVDAIEIARDGAIWFGTQGGGAWRRVADRWSHFGAKEGLPTEQVLSLEEAFDAMWAGTSGGLARFEGERWTPVDLAPAGLAGAKLHVLRAGTLPSGEPTMWVGGEGGLAHCERTRCAAFAAKGNGLPGDVVRAVLETKDALWVGTDQGLARFAGGRWETFDVAGGALPFDEVWALAETTSGSGMRTLWVGTYGGGLARLEGGRWSAITSANSQLPIDYVASLAASEGALGRRTLLVGTDGGGIARLRHDGWVGLVARTSGLPGTGTFGIFEGPDADMWFATDGGLGRWTSDGWKIYRAKDKSLPADYTLAVGRWPRDPDALYFGTYGGLVRWVDGAPTTVFTQKTSPLPGDRVHFIQSSPDGDALFIGTDGGAAIRRGDGWEVYRHGSSPLGEGGVRAMLETIGPRGARSVWFGTDGGLARLEDGRWTTYDPTSSTLENREILAMTEIQRVLWIGTAAGGVARYDLEREQWLPTLDEKSRPALPDTTVYQVREDALHRVYLFTNRGVARLVARTPSSDDPAPFSIYTFTTEDGMPSNECNTGGSFVDSRGRIWAGTIAGAAVFDPAEEVADDAPKTLLLAPPRVGDGARALLPGDLLAHDENTLEFRYALVSPLRERDTRFRTQLVGFDQHPTAWISDAKSKYTNLPEGAYTFRVWGKDYAGNQSGPAEIAFRVKPAPWRTWWAWLSYAVALAAIGYAGHRVRLGALQRRTRELEARVSERTAELDAKNEELAINVRELEIAHAETQRKNEDLDTKVAELAKKNLELEESHRRADLIFSALADVLPGTVLDGKYRLEEKIGKGGFGAVFRATHLALGREVAVKVFRPNQGNDSPQALERFRAEGASACRVAHPNAVQIFDSGISGEGIAYLVMELLHGRSLADEIDEGHTIPLRRCAKILSAVCDVLGAAHEAGLLHRDVKPDNVFLHRPPGGEEQVKVVDFGIAKLMGLDRVQSDLTGTGGLIGTPSYMAPERFGVAPYDARSDVYSVGVTLFEMITGRLPFPYDDRPIFDVVLRQLTSAPPEVKELAPHLPDAAARVVMRCLAKDPAARPSLRELSETFAAAVESLPEDAKDASTDTRPRRAPIDPVADQLAETISYDAPTKPRSRPPPSKRA